MEHCTNEKIYEFLTQYQNNKKDTNIFINKLDAMPLKTQLIFINQVFELTKHGHVDNQNIYETNFKMENYYLLYSYAVDYIFSLYQKNSAPNDKKSIDSVVLTKIIDKITILHKGQTLLNKFDKIINDNHMNINITQHLINSSRHGTFITFLYWLNKTQSKTLNSLKKSTLETIYINSIENSDDRLYKYILKYIDDNDKLFFQQNKTIVEKLLKILSTSCVPIKFQLKRIKYLSERISLIPYFQYMVDVGFAIEIIIELHKYYYQIVHDFDTIRHITSKIIHSQHCEVNKLTFLNILKTEEEKIMFQICLSLYENMLSYTNNNIELFEKIVVNNYITIIKFPDWNIILKSLDTLPINKKILKALTDNNLITKYYLNRKTYDTFPSKMLLFTRFAYLNLKQIKYSVEIIQNNIIQTNLVLHYLRMWAKRVTKTKKIERKVRIYDLLTEIKTFSPNKNIPVLSNGSINYQIMQQKFNNIPPRHLLSGELRNHTSFLLKEKVDGILINNLPVGIFPKCDTLDKYQVKAEYIEDLDLYLLFDIDIPNTTIIERYNIIRNLHEYTKNSKLLNINNLEEMMIIIKQERTNIQKFLKENQTNLIKWYPKFACIYDYQQNDSIYSELINKIILEQDTEFLNNILISDLYNCDGLILTPINGNREIKIKPKSHMTIDLLFDGKMWIDKNKTNWTHLIKQTKNVKPNRIYRCHPNIDNKTFNIGDVRFDKKNPNTFNVIDNILNLLKYDWLNDIENSKIYYYDMKIKIKSNKLIKMLNNQTEILDDMIQKMNPSHNKKWIDFGCGKGKLLNQIKKYNPKSYLGLDIDVKQLVKAVNVNTDINGPYQFNVCNLSDEWDKTENKWFSFNKEIKYNYLIANFSLMHFCCDKFWEQLNDITITGSIFLFNLVDSNKEIKWNESESFLKVENDIVEYKFEWTHKSIKTERLIKDIEISNYMSKYNWKLIDKTTLNKKIDSLQDIYTWWIIEKN